MNIFQKIWNHVVGIQGPSTSNQSENEYSETDTALANYLHFYSKLDAPGYAVLVTGAWGVGKTYQVKKALLESQRYYVSLYGLDSVNSIHDAVLASCLPSIDIGGLLATMGDVGKAMGDKFAIAGIANSVWNAFLRQRLKPDRTIIFDDLERSQLWSGQKSVLLGAVNHYAEHLGFRVVVICHDERILDELAELKEKTFGHTVQAAPQTKPAIEAFIHAIHNETTKAFVIANRLLIEDIWRQSEQSSLRILKHLINDTARLHGVLGAKHLNNCIAITHILRFFCALDIEVRAGNLKREFLWARLRRQIDEVTQRNVEGTKFILSPICSRYPSSDITGNILSDEIVINMLIEGRFDAESLASWLDQTSYFIQTSDEDPWRIVIQFDTLDDETVSQGVARMDSQFDQRTVTNMGEFLHIAALRLMMAEKNVSGRFIEDEVTNCIAYIDNLSTTGRMPAKPLLSDPFNRTYQSYQGFAYWVSEASKPHFREICDYVERAQKQALEAAFPDLAAELLTNIKEDPESIFAKISITNGGKAEFAHVPIFIHISASAFVDAWLSAPRNGWRKITMALDNRYDFRRLDLELSDERPWLIELEKELQSRIDAATGLAAVRLERIKPDVFARLQIPRQND